MYDGQKSDFTSIKIQIIFDVASFERNTNVITEAAHPHTHSLALLELLNLPLDEAIMLLREAALVGNTFRVLFFLI